ncbi:MULTISPECIES: sodium-dependent transporter [Bacteroides]|uniref:Transporter n=2 Tax=Bacteroidaceae TaxID=815 RepID=A0ABT7VGW6_9BACE|nr:MULTISPECIES: sodium-dependent transporter [Bacteroides]MBU3854953.1 sodium-dependent transporter [Candidatus Phocaeicola excrementipullorum]MBW9199751.1 sodium-dependent transporter [Bacteroidales bacterium SW299]MCR8917055.1 sodium-dependent transporter [Bacteroides sp. ET225]MDM8208466.1 sodium-dependent transporter [Bacteroides gallinaceum]MDM8325518.1 sodium-dependent transporter [Bacteroides gallinaceum]
MLMSERVNFGSRIGAILAAAGSAVGLGNVWRFPYETGNHGGAAFILVYLGCVFIFGLPIMIAEFTIGRRSKACTGGAYDALAPGTLWKWVGYLGVLTGFLILGYYSVVAGWTLEYIWQALAGGFAGKSSEDYVVMFQDFSQHPFRPLLWLFVILFITHWVVVKGVKDGIEKSSKIMMPLLFILIVLLAACSISLPGSEKGLEFLLKPDFSKVTPDVFLGAMGQAFFSLSLGMGCLSTYASYFGKKTNLGQTAMSVGLIDTFVAVLSGLIIFPAAFSVGIQPDAGPSLIFITLPNVFQQAFAGVPLLAAVCSAAFYVLLALAAITSTISLHEVSTAFLHEKFRFTRSRAAVLVTSGAMLVGVVSSLALGEWSAFRICGLNMFDALDFLTAKIMLPVGGMFAALFVGWIIRKDIVKGEVTNYGTLRAPYYPVYRFILRFVAPVGILLIFVNELGWLG